MTSIEDLIDEARLPRKTVLVCTRGDLRARWDELHARFKAAPVAGGSLGEPSPRHALGVELEELRAEMATHEVPFTFEALPGPEFSELLLAHPGKGASAVNVKTMVPALIAACCVEPKMDVEQAGRLLSKLSAATGDLLSDAAWSVNREATDVPFDASVYATTQAADAS